MARKDPLQPAGHETLRQEKMLPGLLDQLHKTPGEPGSRVGLELIEGKAEPHKRIQGKADGIQQAAGTHAQHGQEQGLQPGAQLVSAAVPLADLYQDVTAHAGRPRHDGGLIGRQPDDGQHDRGKNALRPGPLRPHDAMDGQQQKERGGGEPQDHVVIIVKIRDGGVAGHHDGPGKQGHESGVPFPEQDGRHARGDERRHAQQRRVDGYLHMPVEHVQEGEKPAPGPSAAQQRDAVHVADIMIPQRELGKIVKVDDDIDQQGAEEGLFPGGRHSLPDVFEGAEQIGMPD